MVGIGLYPIFGRPFVIYLGVLTLASFFLTAVFGFSYYRGWLKFKWHPTMVVISFILAMLMTFIGLSLHKPLVGTLGILALFSFIIASLIGLGIHQRKFSLQFTWHPGLVIFAFIFAVLHGVVGVLTFS